MHRRILVALTGVVVVAAICGAVVIAVTQSGSDPGASDSSSDLNIEYPDALAEVPFWPGALAIDPESGTLWFAGPTNGAERALFHYSASEGSVTARKIPASANYIFFAIAVDSTGHAITAEGSTVLDIDPAGGYVEHHLSPLGNISDMVLSDDDKAYVSKDHAAAITELDLRTGDIREFPLPRSMSLVHRIELAGDRLWMTAPISTEDTPAQTAALDLATGVTEVIPMKTSALAADGEGRVFVSRQISPAVVAVDERDASLAAGPWTFTTEHDNLSWNPDLLAVDKERGRVWAAGGGSGIVSVETATGKQEYYGLPSAAETMPFSVVLSQLRSRCPTPREDDCWRGRPFFTSVDGIAVAPNGDLYFADSMFNRIGIVHPR